MGADQPVGRTPPQRLHDQGRWLALVEWRPAAYKLADSGACIGWPATQHAQRLGLLVQNRWFLLLSATRCPKLASRALALAAQALRRLAKAAVNARRLNTAPCRGLCSVRRPLDCGGSLPLSFAPKQVPAEPKAASAGGGRCVALARFGKLPDRRLPLGKQPDKVHSAD